MRIVATGLLVFMACLYVATRWAEPVHPTVGFVRAFAEAAMVGGLADWFAVTALFRHPMGLPIPHTAIIPRNKDRIGEALALFLRDNFLPPAVVARRMGRLDVAGAAGRLLATPSVGDQRVRSGASRMIADVLDALGDERLGGMIKGALVQRISQLNAAPLLGQLLAAAMKDGRTFSGMIVEQTATSISLARPDGKRETLLRIDIDELSSTGKSFMPEGLEKDLTPQDVADVVAFLQAPSVP
jgi:uncharacterized membrane-anchored protein YjiN (DUF445 family)